MANDKIIKRLGNNIKVSISVNDGANLTTLLGFTPNYEIRLVKSFGRTYEVKDTDITADLANGTFSFTWKAGHQYGVGDYTLILRLYEETEGEETGNFNTVDMEQAIRLTKHTCQGTSMDNELNIKFSI